jgi:hypothetical protein
VVVFLDAASFSMLFDIDLVDKTDLMSSTFMSSTGLTGGHHMLSYIDPHGAEPHIAQDVGAVRLGRHARA